MIIKSLRLRLYLENATSLKDKRRYVKSIKAKCRQKFNVSIAEIDSHDEIKYLVLAVVCVTNDNGYADELLDKCLNLIQQDYDLDVVDIIRERL